MLYFQCLRAFHPCFITGETFTVQKNIVSCRFRELCCVFSAFFLPATGAVTILLHLKNHRGEKKVGEKVTNKMSTYVRSFQC